MFLGVLAAEPMEFTLCFGKIISYFDSKKPLTQVENEEYYNTFVTLAIFYTCKLNFLTIALD
jgi:hypothetical protein